MSSGSPVANPNRWILRYRANSDPSGPNTSEVFHSHLPSGPGAGPRSTIDPACNTTPASRAACAIVAAIGPSAASACSAHRR